jgi:hypothetical protein
VLPSHLVTFIVETYFQSFAHFAADIVRRFNFVQPRIQDTLHRAVPSAVCIHPFYALHQKNIGLQGPLLFSPNGFPYMEAPTITMQPHDLRIIFGGSQAFLDTRGWSEQHLDALSNGLQKHNWATDLTQVVERFFDGDISLICIGIFAASLGHKYHSIHQDAAIFHLEESDRPDDIAIVYNDLTFSQYKAVFNNHYRDAILTTMHGFDDIAPAVDTHLYPFMPLCILGLLSNDHIADSMVSFSVLRNIDVMAVVYSTVLLLKHERPNLLKRFVGLVRYGLDRSKLMRNDLTDCIVERIPYVRVFLDAAPSPSPSPVPQVLVTPTAPSRPCNHVPKRSKKDRPPITPPFLSIMLSPI